MNTRTRYVIPAIAGMVVMMAIMAFTVPAMAVQSQSASTSGTGSEHPLDDPLQYIQLVSGFEGAVQIQFDSGTDQMIEEKINVTLADAAAVAEENGLIHATGARMEVIRNDQDNTYLVWTIHGYDSARSETVGHSPDIFVVDTGDVTNFALTTKEWNQLNMPDASYDLEMKFFEEFNEDDLLPTGDAEHDALQAEFLGLIKQLKTAHDDGDSQKADQLRQQIRELGAESVHISNPDI